MSQTPTLDAIFAQIQANIEVFNHQAVINAARLTIEKEILGTSKPDEPVATEFFSRFERQGYLSDCTRTVAERFFDIKSTQMRLDELKSNDTRAFSEDESLIYFSSKMSEKLSKLPFLEKTIAPFLQECRQEFETFRNNTLAKLKTREDEIRAIEKEVSSLLSKPQKPLDFFEKVVEYGARLQQLKAYRHPARTWGGAPEPIFDERFTQILGLLKNGNFFECCNIGDIKAVL